MLNLICHNRALCARKLRQDRRVIASPSPYVEDDFPLTYIQGRKVNCVKNRLPVVNSSFRSKSDDDILVQKSWIVAGGLYVIAGGKYLPRTFTDKVLSRDRCERAFKPFVLHRACAGGNQIWVEVSVCFQTVHIPPPSRITRFIARILNLSTSRSVNGLRDDWSQWTISRDRTYETDSLIPLRISRAQKH